MTNIYHDEMIATRRAIHEYPEEGWTEFVTTAFIVNRLKNYSCKILLGRDVVNPDHALARDMKLVQKGIERARAKGVSEELLAQMQELTGCVAVFETGRPGPVLGLRYDIDCVPVQESSDADHFPAANGFASKNCGLMHACGHDTHATLGLTVAHWVHDNIDTLNGTIKILFQPAEEGVRGAAGVAESGVFDDVDYFVSCHAGVGVHSGEICTRPEGFLCTTKYDISFTGRPAHAGSSPEEGRNALAAAIHAAGMMLGISRHGKGMTRINVGQLIAGEGRNVIPTHALMKIEIRGENSDINEYMKESVTRICEGAATAYDVQYKMEKMGEAFELVNDEELIKVVDEATAEAGLTVSNDGHKLGGSEDATVLCKRVQKHGGKSCYFIWGSDLPSGHHTAKFDIEEKNFDGGLAVWQGVIRRLAK